jgi:hypothetical protein
MVRSKPFGGILMNGNITCCIHFLGIMILLTACSNAGVTPTSTPPTAMDFQIGDGGLLSGYPCGPPCFLGVRPDVTDYDEVIGILSENHDLNYCKEFDNSQEGGSRGIYCADSYLIGFDRARTVVTHLGFTPSMEITLQEVVEIYGDPSRISVSTGGYAKTVSKARVFYPQYTMSILLEEQDGDMYLVQPSSKVDTIGYEGESSFQKSIEGTQKWSGYGEYFMQYR